ncbi:MAG: YfhO family protein [Elusimicrobiota bacterium]
MSPPVSKRGFGLLPAALILAIAASFFFRLWACSGILYSPHSDLIAQGVGLRAIERRSLIEERRWPLWDSSASSGSPAHANPLTAYTFPLNWPFLVLPLDRAANMVFLLNALLAGLGMLVCARRFLERPGAALFCGVAYMLSYRYLALFDAGWLPTIAMYSLAPLLFWTADRLMESPGPARTAQFAAVLALSAMQGSAQSFYYALLALAAFAAWHAASMPRAGRLRAALALLAGGALALMLAAPDLLPRAQFAALSTRLNFDYRFFLGKAPSLSSLSTFLDPGDAGGTRFEYWENNFYFGLWLYPLALWACWKDWRRSRALLAAFAVFVFLSFDSPVLRLLFDYFPGFALFRRSTRLLQLAQLAGVGLAGIGADAVLRGPWRGREAAAVALLCLLPIADSGARMIPRLTTKPLAQAFPEPAFAALLRRSPTGGRVAAAGRTVVSYGQASYFGIDMVNGYEPLNLRSYLEYFSLLQTGDPARTPRAAPPWGDLTEISRPDMLRALDAEYIAANRPVPVEQIGWDFVGRRDDAAAFDFYRGLVRNPVYLWRDRRPLGPAYFASSLTPVRTEAESLSAVAASSSVLQAQVFGWDGGVGMNFAGGSARMTRRGENIYEYEVDSKGSNFLILSQVWYPGWRATLDGKNVQVYRTNHALLGLVVPPGPHELKLEMTSPALEAGLVLFALGLMFTGGLFAWERRQRTAASGGRVS